MKALFLSRFSAVVFVAMLVLGVLFATQLVPQARQAADLRGDVRTLSKALEAARPGTPSGEDLGSWVRYGTDLKRDYERIVSFYGDNDRRFDRWFPDLPLGPAKAPSRDAFVTRLRDEARILEERLRRLSVTVGPENEDGALGFNWEPLTIQQLDAVGPADETAVLHAVQKRFWARKRIADLAIEGKVQIRRIVDFRFFGPLHDRIRVAAPGSEKVLWPGLGGEPPRDFREIPLPGGVGRTFTFGAVLELPVSEVPRAIRELLNPGPDLLLTVIGANVILGSESAWIKVPHDEGEEAEEFERRFREAKKAHPPRPVLLVLSCRILDFDLPQAK